MKKIIFIIAIIPLLITAIAIQFLPSEVPIHFDLNGSPDGYGSKYVYFIAPIIALLLALFWLWILYRIELKCKKASSREIESYKSNSKVLCIVAVLNISLLSAVHLYLLFKMAFFKEGAIENLDIDVFKLSSLLSGIMFIIAGNYLPKTKKNDSIGLRISWSMYNDVTWQKSNYFCGIAFIIAGLLTIVSTAFCGSYIILLLMLLYLSSAIAVSLTYAHKVYQQELNNKA